jgi:hypothetical protein
MMLRPKLGNSKSDNRTVQVIGARGSKMTLTADNVIVGRSTQPKMALYPWTR